MFKKKNCGAVCYRHCEQSRRYRLIIYTTVLIVLCYHTIASKEKKNNFFLLYAWGVCEYATNPVSLPPNQNELKFSNK